MFTTTIFIMSDRFGFQSHYKSKSIAQNENCREKKILVLRYSFRKCYT